MSNRLFTTHPHTLAYCPHSTDECIMGEVAGSPSPYVHLVAHSPPLGPTMFVSLADSTPYLLRPLVYLNTWFEPYSELENEVEGGMMSLSRSMAVTVAVILVPLRRISLDDFPHGPT